MYISKFEAILMVLCAHALEKTVLADQLGDSCIYGPDGVGL